MLRYNRRPPEVWINSTGDARAARDDFEQRQPSGDESESIFRHADVAALMSRSRHGLWKIWKRRQCNEFTPRIRVHLLPAHILPRVLRGRICASQLFRSIAMCRLTNVMSIIFHARQPNPFTSNANDNIFLNFS